MVKASSYPDEASGWWEEGEGMRFFSYTSNRPLRGNVICSGRLRADGTAIRGRFSLLMYVIMPENERVIDYKRSRA